MYLVMNNALANLKDSINKWVELESDSPEYRAEWSLGIVGLHLEIPGLLIAYHTIDNLDDARAYISRLQSVGAPIDQFIAFFKERERKGFLIPKNVMPRLIQAAESIISGELQQAETQNVLFSDFNRKIKKRSFAEELQVKLIAEMVQAMQAEFIPAYQRLIKVFQQQQNLDLSDV